MSHYRPDYNDRNHPLLVSQKTMSSEKLRQFLSQQNNYEKNPFQRQNSLTHYDIPEFDEAVPNANNSSADMIYANSDKSGKNKLHSPSFSKPNALRRVSAPKVIFNLQPGNLKSNDSSGENQPNTNNNEVKSSIELGVAPINHAVSINIPLSLNKRIPQFNIRVSSPISELPEEKEEKTIN